MAKGSRTTRKLPPDLRALTLIAQARDLAVEARCFTGKKRLDLWRDIANVVSAAHFQCVKAVQACLEGERKDEAREDQLPQEPKATGPEHTVLGKGRSGWE